VENRAVNPMQIGQDKFFNYKGTLTNQGSLIKEIDVETHYKYRRIFKEVNLGSHEEKLKVVLTNTF
jgi:hypothetical protein